MRPYLFSLLIILIFGCSDKFEHNPTLAAQKAEEFAALAYVKQDFDGAYALLADGIRRHVSPAQFKQTLAKNQTGAKPAKVVAQEYEPMSGEKAIYIYLVGDTVGAQNSIRITMEGTADSGYKVLRFDSSGFNLSIGERKKLPQ